MTHAAAQHELREADRAIRDLTEPRTLAPDRELATPLEELGATLLGDAMSSKRAVELATALRRIVETLIETYPDNLFWDFDFLAARLTHRGASLSRVTGRVVELSERFGRHPIAFRYTHDFAYGFDWAKWVAAEPGARDGIGPFDLEFLDALFRRGGELLELIERNDAKYGVIPRGQARNPFPFSREPEHEGRILRDLAGRGLVPVEAWRRDARPDWQRNYAQLRIERAEALGIPARSAQP